MSGVPRGLQGHQCGLPYKRSVRWLLWVTTWAKKVEPWILSPVATVGQQTGQMDVPTAREARWRAGGPCLGLSCPGGASGSSPLPAAALAPTVRAWLPGK